MAKTKVMSNLDSIGELVGTFMGMSDGLSEDEYMEGLIKQAHGKAANVFDVAAAATASTGRMRHVYEYGTAGITGGKTTHHDPTSPLARLWVHTINGNGGSQNIGYSFRLAKDRNPQPTTESTGVASKYLSRLSKRKYVFFNKAFVMETGQTVEIHAKNGDYLFVPFNGEPAKNPLNTKGYIMWNTKAKGPIISTPGRTTKGTFTGFWMRWWSTSGNQIVSADMEKSVSTDIEAAVEAAVKRANAVAVKPTNHVHETATKARGLMERVFGIKRKDAIRETVI